MALHPGTEDRSVESSEPQRGGLFRLRLRWMALAMAGGAALILALWLGSGSDDASIRDTEVPVIRADEAPLKVRPEDPGGMVVAHRDKLVYRRLGDHVDEVPVERLLPEPEEPLPPPVPAEPPAPGAGPEASPETEAGADPFGEGLSVPWDALEDGTEPAAGDPERGIDAPPAPPPADTALAEPEQLSPEAEAAQALLMPSAGGSYRVQLASVRSRADAEAEWRRLSRRHGDLLGPLSPDYSSAEVADRGVFYRLRAGPLRDAQQARRLCAALAERNVGCMVVSGG
ncbi:MAG: SPOR domain-containing protein [Rhodospirillales bacterium]|nr:MAG: SPOR domain-containing protein [Rhodospirillales bacterium]